jgi:all-trans-retinol 13,14-reductase
VARAPQIYLSFPSLKDPEARAHTAEIIAPVDANAFARWRGTAWMKRGPDYLSLKERFTGHPDGEIYGIPVTPERFRLPWLQVRTPVPGLYLTGADAGMLGIGGALMTGVLCTAAVAGASTFGKVIAAAKGLPDPVVPAATPAAPLPAGA